MKVVFTSDLLQRTGSHIQHNGSVNNAAAELKETVKRESGHVGFTPPLPTVLHILFKLQPPARDTDRVKETDTCRHRC